MVIAARAENDSAVAAGQLKSKALGTADIVFMVVAAAAPMAVTVGLMPMAFAFGNGAGVTLSWLCAVGAMLLFAVGYVRIVPFVRNAGAFYAYIAAGIGRTWGLGAAYVAALSYFCLSCSTVGGFSFFSEQLFEQVTGHHLHWGLWALGAIAVMGWLSYRQITLAAAVLGVALVAEIVMLTALDARILFVLGPKAVDFSMLSPGWLLAPGLGITSIYAFNSMIGVEGTAIYQEEARNRAVTVPRATYISLGLVGLFYVFTAWCLTIAVGSTHVAAVARSSPNTFVIDRCVTYLGTTGATVVGVLVLTSTFAAALGLSNNAARYLFALARDGVLPAALARTHPTYQSPHVAGLTTSAGLLLVIACAVALGLDPLFTVQNALAGLGSVGLMALLGITSLVIPVFFLKRGGATVANALAPACGGIVILIATVIAFMNYSALTGVASVVINHLPYLLIAVAAIGMAQGLWFRAQRPGIYHLIGSARVDR
jgi:amino acid transporter